MTEVFCPENILEEIRADQIPEKAMAKIAEGYRFSQACAATVDNHLELSYSFAHDETYQFYTFRILPAAKAGIFNNISTVISILAGGLILHEPLTIVHIVCAAVVITAAIIINGRKDQLT